MTLLRQADPGPLPLPQAALGTGVPQMPGGAEEGAQLWPPPTNNLPLPA